jgi:hypothetical protein
MTQRSRCAFSRFARMVTAVTAVVLFGAGSLLAQGTTGKIEGTVKDSSGAPIAGAQVLITGSAFTATTDAQGYYFINNVPAGVLTVRAQYIGFAPAERRNVRVFAGQTMTVDITLVQRAIEVTGITVTVEQNPIVPRDQVTSKTIITNVDQLPVDNVNQVLALQPGVVQTARGLTIRGSRPNETATYIDGVLVRNYGQQFMGIGSSTTVSVGTNAVEEASVTTGAAGAEYGEAAGGVVSLVTRAGGSQLHGSVSYATDNVGGQVYGSGLNRIEASAGGPIVKNLTWFIGTTLEGEQNPLQSKGRENYPYWVLDGIDTTVMVPLSPGTQFSDSMAVNIPAFRQYASGCSGAAAFAGTCKSTRRPNNNQDHYTFDGKIQYSFGAGSRISGTWHRSRDQGLNGTPLFDPVAQRGNRTLSDALILNWTQNLARSSERALFLDANLSWQRDQYVQALVDPSWMEGHQNPFGWFNTSNIKFVNDLSNFPITDQLIQNLRLNNCLGTRAGGVGACIPYLNRNDLAQASAYRFNPYGVTAGAAYYATDGLPVGFGGGPVLNQETRVGGRAHLDWQANRYNRVQVGGDYTKIDMLAFTSQLTTQAFMDAYHFKPDKLGLYAQDRIDLGDVVVQFGLRYDRFNSGIIYPRVPGRVFTDPFRSTSLTLTDKLAMSYNAQDSAMARACQAALDANAATAGSGDAALATCNYFKAAPQSILSPNLQVSFPVTDRTGFRLSYAHEVLTPDFSSMGGGTNLDLSRTNTNDVFGRPLTFGKTIIFEFGIRHAFSDDMVLDISAYNKDKVSDITARTLPIYDPFVGGPGNATNENINLMTNADFGNTRGVDVKLDRRIGTLFQGTISYTYETAKSTGSDPYEYLNTYSRQISAVTGERVPPPQALITVRDNRSHTIAGNVALNFPHGWDSGTLLGSILQDAGAFATFRFQSGLPYTRIENVGGGTRGPGNGFGLVATGLETLNSSVMPWVKIIDLRLTKGIRLGGRDLSVFADFRNLFNWTNLGTIFAETGDVRNEVYKNNVLSPIVQNLQNDAGSLYKTKQIDVNGVTQTVTGVDLTDCSLYPWGTGGTKGVPDCLSLRSVDQRYGNGDGFLSTSEINTAYTAYYNSFASPASFYGSGFNLRLGFEFNF